MKKKTVLAITILFVFALFLPGNINANDNFLSLLPWGNIVTGNVSYEDTVGKPVVVMFGNTSCWNCGYVFPLIDSLITQEKMENDLHLLYFDLDYTDEEIRSYVREAGYRNVSAYRAGNSGNNIMWRILSTENISGGVMLPVIVYFSSSGIITKVSTGVPSLPQIKSYISEITGRQLGDRPIANVTSLTIGTSLSGHISAGGEYWYSVTVPSGGNLIVETTGDTDTYMTAFDHNYMYITEDDDSGAGYNARITLRAAPNSTYYFMVEGYWQYETGPFRIIARME